MADRTLPRLAFLLVFGILLSNLPSCTSDSIQEIANTTIANNEQYPEELAINCVAFQGVIRRKHEDKSNSSADASRPFRPRGRDGGRKRPEVAYRCDAARGRGGASGTTGRRGTEAFYLEFPHKNAVHNSNVTRSTASEDGRLSPSLVDDARSTGSAISCSGFDPFIDTSWMPLKKSHLRVGAVGQTSPEEVGKGKGRLQGVRTAYRCEGHEEDRLTVLAAVYMSLVRYGGSHWHKSLTKKVSGHHSKRGFIIKKDSNSSTNHLDYLPQVTCMDLTGSSLQDTSSRLNVNKTDGKNSTMFSKGENISKDCETGGIQITLNLRDSNQLLESSKPSQGSQNSRASKFIICPSKKDGYSGEWHRLLDLSSKNNRNNPPRNKSLYSFRYFKMHELESKREVMCHVSGRRKEGLKARRKRNAKGSVPEVMYTFIEQAVQPGAHISLKCSASGDPPPRFDWLLDTQYLTAPPHRYSIGQFMDHTGFVISHLNITGVRVEDGGLYECRASNTRGHTSHSARLNVYGPPYIRSIGIIKGVTGEDITILCPYYGYPISYVKWDSQTQKISSNPRYKQELGLLRISNLDPQSDSGAYMCSVATPGGEMARREIQLQVNSPPVLSPLVFPPNLKAGERAQLSCTVTSGDMPVFFSWLKDGLPIPSSLQVEERNADFLNYLLFKSLTAAHSGTYTCISTNSAGKVNTSAELVIKVPPYWNYEPQDISTLLGSSITVNCDARGYPEPRTYWSKQHNRANEDYDPISPIGGHLIVFNNGSLLINSISSNDEGNYRCTAENGVGAVLYKNIIIDVNEPARFESSTQNITARRNDPVTLVCDVLGDNPIHNVWSHNTNPIDTNNYRLSLSELKKDSGVRSQLSIERADRQDSGRYRCQASNNYGRSEHFIHLAVQERPDPPSQLEVIEVASRSVRLAWRRPFDGNSPVLGYLVQYQPLGPSSMDTWDSANIVNLTIATSGPQAIASTIGDGLEQGVVSGLLPDTTYSMRMLAVNQIESSSFTDTIVAKTQEEAPTEPPQNVQVQAGDAGELVITWQPPPRTSWNGPLLGYTISWTEAPESEGVPPQGGAAPPTKHATVKGSGSSRFPVTGLRQFTRYRVTVRAYNRAAAGPASIPIMALTREGVPSAPPQLVRCEPLSSQSLKIEWTSPPRAHHGGTLLGYKILYKPLADIFSDDTLPASEVKRTSSSETYLHALLKFTNYSIQVLAYTGAGDGTLSPAVFCTTEEDVPGAPADIKAISLTANSILVSWLAPRKPNGKIVFYTLYYREAGRSGQPLNQVVNAAEANAVATVGLGGAVEVRKLNEKGRYEFWLTASTGAGEGEATTLVTQTTTTRASARIASFGVSVRGGSGRSLTLGCMSVGNPTPRARWLHSQKPITHSHLYRVTAEGNLFIHSVDKSVSGNYTCSAKNLFGADDITYSVVCLMPPGPPTLEVVYTTANSAQIQWRPTADGGSSITGYSLSYRRVEESSQVVDLPSETTSYNVAGLKCGSRYSFQIAAHNRVGKGAPSTAINVNTKGDAPKLPDDWDELTWSNASCIVVDVRRSLDAASSGCPLTGVGAEWRRAGAAGGTWRALATPAQGPLALSGLAAAAWYELRITAENHAGRSTAVVRAATTTLTGALISPPSYYPMEPPMNHDFEGSQDNIFSIISLVFATVAAISTLSVAYILVKKRSVLCHCSNQSDYGGDRQRSQSQASDEKTICAEQQNMRNCQHDYSTSPIKGHAEKMRRESAEMYEISPYATFQVGGPNRPVAASTLDHTLQFRTFGHMDNDALPLQAPCKRHYTQKTHRHNMSKDDDKLSGCELQPLRGGRARPRQCSGPSYCVPIPQQDLFQRESSTESNELSPPPDRARTPRHYAERALQVHQSHS